MSVVVVTGSAGLIGAETSRFFSHNGLAVVGIDNDMRRNFFGDQASTAWARMELQRQLPDYTHVDADIRDTQGIDKVFARYGDDILAVIHTAA